MAGLLVGGIGGALVFLCFSGALGAPPLSEPFARFLLLTTTPILYLFIDVLGSHWIPFLILVQGLYWAIIGAVVACGLTGFYSLILRKHRMFDR